MDRRDDLPEEPALRERLPGYAVLFGIGIGLAVVAGLVWSLFVEASVFETTAWSAWIIGTILFLLGGTSGSGLSRMSTEDYGIHYGRRHQHGFDDTQGE
ncbi:MAG: hypothetical protein HKN93_00465, partial [Acidimicrobiia bacterium]|nr:hypothetical protein [Acidimicrobiia bacterium]